MDEGVKLEIIETRRADDPSEILKLLWSHFAMCSNWYVIDKWSFQRLRTIDYCSSSTNIVPRSCCCWTEIDVVKAWMEEKRERQRRILAKAWWLPSLLGEHHWSLCSFYIYITVARTKNRGNCRLEIQVWQWSYYKTLCTKVRNQRHCKVMTPKLFLSYNGFHENTKNWNVFCHVWVFTRTSFIFHKQMLPLFSWLGADQGARGH